MASMAVAILGFFVRPVFLTLVVALSGFFVFFVVRTASVAILFAWCRRRLMFGFGFRLGLLFMIAVRFFGAAVGLFVTAFIVVSV